MSYFTQKTISVGIFAAVFLFLLLSLQHPSSSTFLPITWARGVRFGPFKDQFAAFSQGNPFLQSNFSFSSFQPARAAVWPPDPCDLFGDLGILPPSSHAITPQNFSPPLGNFWKDRLDDLFPRSQAFLAFCSHDSLVWLRFSNTSNGLVDLCTVGSFPHPWLDFGLDLGGQPLAWLGCLINVSHALGSNPTVWDGIPAVCFMGNGWFGSGLGLLLRKGCRTGVRAVLQIAALFPGTLCR
jgi:hypothetical protein